MRREGLLCICVILAVVLVGAHSFPRSDRTTPNSQFSPVRHYRGFGLWNDRGILSKNYFRLDPVLTLPEDGTCQIDFDYGSQTHPFHASYPDGKLRAQGTCALLLDQNGQPAYLDDFVDGVFVSPDGKETSQMRNGTGVETFWTHNGVKIWEAKREKLKPIAITQWHRNGQLEAVLQFKDGIRDGTTRYFDSDGKLEETVIFKDGIDIDRIEEPASP